MPRTVKWKVRATGEPFEVVLDDHEYDLFAKLRDRAVALPEGAERSEALNEVCFLMEGKRAGARLISEEEMEVKGLMYGPNSLTEDEPEEPSAEVLQLREDTLQTMERLEAEGFKIPAQAKLEVAGLMQASLLDPEPEPPAATKEPEPFEEQPAKLADEAFARSTDPGTSHAAAASLSPEELRDSQAAVLSLLRKSGPGTDEDIAERYEGMRGDYGWPQQSPSGLRTRRAELVDAGYVVDTGQVKTLGSGRKSIVWSSDEF